MEYNHREIENKWQAFWEQNQTYRVEIDKSKPKYYVLDMFPYPSGAGLHVGHPLGYIASDIVSRYKTLKGFNVLHPMGFDSFGLPAEQYAIQTGQHPAITTEQNINTYIKQLKQIGFCYDWSREVRTSDPSFYKWTQWIFMELFKSWYNKTTDKAETIETLYAHFEANGTQNLEAVCDEDCTEFTAKDWKSYTETEKYTISLKYRLTYLSEAVVNFCPALGMVLSNDEVKDGVSERGGHPVIQKKMKQWVMRITAYCQRLLDGLDKIDWTESLKDQQRNWIGRSVGASVRFRISDFGFRNDEKETHHSSLITHHFIEVFTTRVDTIYGVTFMVLAPEHELVAQITTPEQKEAVDTYILKTQKRSELDRTADTKQVSGVFTGAYCLNPLNNEKVPIYLADYVLAGYGTGAVMAVPSGDQRDYNFAKHFNLPIIPILDAQKNVEGVADNTKEGYYVNSGIVNGMEYKEATQTLIQWLEERGMGKGKINYRLRDAVFARQRYWGEPVPVYYKEGLPHLISETDLPLILPEIDKYLPTQDGEPPLARAEGWNYSPLTPDGGTKENILDVDFSSSGVGGGLELSTMPGWAGSSWYFYRYMDSKNENEFASKEALDYWQDVDLYLGGTEHATGHLLYSRFWCKFMFDRGFVPTDEYAKKLINQGMIQGRSNFVYRVKSPVATVSLTPEGGIVVSSTFVSYNLKDKYDTVRLHVDVNIVDNDVLDIEKFKATRNDIGENPVFILENDKYVCGAEVEKMSKSKYNVVNPDDIVSRYGADTLRLYEMFLGPLEQAKPWNTNGIDGVYRFIRKMWRLFFDENGNILVKDEAPSKEELKVLHKTIKKVEEDIENFSFNTSVSAFMVCVNDLSSLKCHKKAILQDLLLILSPYSPHFTEELWQVLGNQTSITKASFPKLELSYLVDDAFEYPVQINGKVRISLSFGADVPSAEIEKTVLANETVQKWLEGKTPKKIIVVPKRIVNVVV